MINCSTSNDYINSIGPSAIFAYILSVLELLNSTVLVDR